MRTAEAARRQAARLVAATMLAAGALALPAGVAAADDAPPAPTLVEIQTEPPLPGAVLSVEGTRFTTDRDGRASALITMRDETLPALTVVDDGIADPNRRARFSRWWGLSTAGKGTRVRAAFDFDDRITWSYAHLDGGPIDPAVVSALVVRSSHGNVHDLGPPEPIWLHSVRVVPTVGGLTAKEIEYRIDSVVVDGAEVVIRSQQKFTPAHQRTWVIRLHFYLADFSARDGLLGFPLGGAALQVEYPSGRREAHRLSADGTLRLRLPRGSYKALVEAPGMRVWTPVALSRDQQIPIKVLTYLDMAVGAGTLASIALGLLVVGRPRQVFRIATWPVSRWQRVARWRERWRPAGPEPPEAHRSQSRPALIPSAAAAPGPPPIGGAASPIVDAERPQGPTVPAPSLHGPLDRPPSRPPATRNEPIAGRSHTERPRCVSGCRSASPGARFCRACGLQLEARRGTRASVP